jgi:hypothetical protein
MGTPNRITKINKSFGDYAILALSFGLAPSGRIYMQFEKKKPPGIPNAPFRAARIKDERWRSAGPGFEPGRAGPRLSLRSCQEQQKNSKLIASNDRAYAAVYVSRCACGCHRRRTKRSTEAHYQGPPLRVAGTESPEAGSPLLSSSSIT